MDDVDWDSILEDIDQKVRKGSIGWAMENLRDLQGEIQERINALRGDLRRGVTGGGEE